jgi:hypothetical protein
MLDPSIKKEVMYLIPFLYNKQEDLCKFYIFLDKGNKFIEMDSSEIDDFCEVNGIYYDKKNIKDDYCFIKVNSKTDLKSFYSYTENSGAECWRYFILFNNDILHINSTNPEFIQPILKMILAGV